MATFALISTKNIWKLNSYLRDKSISICKVDQYVGHAARLACQSCFSRCKSTKREVSPEETRNYLNAWLGVVPGVQFSKLAEKDNLFESPFVRSQNSYKIPSLILDLKGPLDNILRYFELDKVIIPALLGGNCVLDFKNCEFGELSISKLSALLDALKVISANKFHMINIFTHFHSNVFAESASKCYWLYKLTNCKRC